MNTTATQCVEKIGRERMTRCPRPATTEQYGYTVCTVHAAAFKRGNERREANAVRSRADLSARVDRQIATARMAAAYPALLAAAISTVEVWDASHTICQADVDALRAAIAKAGAA